MQTSLAPSGFWRQAMPPVGFEPMTPAHVLAMDHTRRFNPLSHHGQTVTILVCLSTHFGNKAIFPDSIDNMNIEELLWQQGLPPPPPPLTEFGYRLLVHQYILSPWIFSIGNAVLHSMYVYNDVGNMSILLYKRSMEAKTKTRIHEYANRESSQYHIEREIKNVNGHRQLCTYVTQEPNFLSLQKWYRISSNTCWSSNMWKFTLK